MPSLIAPELMAQMIQARSMPMAMGGGGAAPSPDQMGMFQRAHAMRAGNAGMGQMTPQAGPQGGRGPLANAVGDMKQKQLMFNMMAWGEGEDEQKKKAQEAIGTNEINPAAYRESLGMIHQGRQVRAQQPTMNFGEQAAQPQNPNAGTMSIAAGSGKAHTDLEGRTIAARPAMTAQQLQAGAQRIAQQGDLAGHGEAAESHYGPAQTHQMLSPGGQAAWKFANPNTPAPSVSTPGQYQGYTVGGMNGPQQPQQAGGDAASALKGMGANDQEIAWAKYASAQGMPAQQVMSELQRSIGARATAQRSDEREAASATKTEVSTNVKVLEAQKKILAEHGEDTSALDQQIAAETAKLKPQQQAAPQQHATPQASATGPNGEKLHLINGKWTSA